MTEAGLTCESVKKINGEEVLDVEVTANRPDWMSIVGVAREIAAIQGLSTKIKEPKKLPRPAKPLPIKLNVDFDLFDRWAGVILTDIQIKPSPKWLQDKILSMNARPINNVIDITNYVMYEYGIPMHAFDYDEIRGSQMTVKKTEGGESFTSVDGISYQLPKDAIVINDKERLIDLAGIKGGLNSGIKDSTKKIFLHVTIDNPVLIRRTSIKMGLRSEASAIYERVPDKGGVVRALTRAANLVAELANGKIASNIIDIKKANFDPWKINLTFKKLARVLGIEIPEKEVLKILSKLNLSPKKTTLGISCTIPTYRADLKIEEDLAEEVARIYGYNKFPTSLPSGATNPIEIPYHFDDSFINKLKELLISSGYSETMILSLISKDLIEKTGGSSDMHIKLINPVSNDYEYLRTSIVSSLLPGVKLNNADKLQLFEVDKVYTKSGKKYNESYKLGVIAKGISFRQFKGLVDLIVDRLNIKNYKTNFDSTRSYLHPLRSGSISIGAEVAIDFGEVHPEVTEKFQAGSEIYVLEADISLLRKSAKTPIFKTPPLNPAQIEDLTLILPPKTRIGEVVNTMISTDSIINKVYLKDIFGNSYTFRVWYQDPKRTLTNADVEKIRKQIISSVKTRFGAQIRE